MASSDYRQVLHGVFISFGLADFPQSGDTCYKNKKQKIWSFEGHYQKKKTFIRAKWKTIFKSENSIFNEYPMWQTEFTKLDKHPIIIIIFISILQ